MVYVVNYDRMIYTYHKALQQNFNHGVIYMTDWRITPCPIDTPSCSYDYALFIDESGQSTYKNVTMERKWFTLCGCLVHKSDLLGMRNEIMRIKTQYWTNGEFAYKKGVKRVVFHMKEIAEARKGICLKNNPFCMPHLSPAIFASFEREYNQLINDSPFIVFSVSVDKMEMLSRYGTNAYDPYTYALTLLFERVTDFINASNSHAKVIVLFEQRRKREDVIAHKKLISILDHGTPYIAASNFSWICGAHFCEKNTPDGRSYYGLEVADFCAFPVKMYFAKNVQTNEFILIRPKIYCGGRNCANSFGLKKVP